MKEILHIGSFSGINNGPFNVISEIVIHKGTINNFSVLNLRNVDEEDPISLICQKLNIAYYEASRVESFEKFFSQFDVLHFHGVFVLDLIKLARVKFSGTKILTPHGNLNKESLKNSKLKKSIYLYLNKSYFSSFDIVHSLTDYEASNLEQWFQKDQIKVISNGISDVKLERVEKNLEFLKFGYIGRIDIRHKGLDRLLYEYQKVNIESELNIAGLTSNKDSQILKNKVNKVNNSGNNGNKINLYPSIIGSKKEQFFLDQDYFVLLSRNEGLPLAALEAIALEIPVIVSPETNISPIVDKFNCGIVINASKFSDLVNSGKLHKLEKYRSMTAGCRKAKHALAWDKIGARYDKYLYGSS